MTSDPHYLAYNLRSYYYYDNMLHLDDNCCMHCIIFEKVASDFEQSILIICYLVSFFGKYSEARNIVLLRV